MSLSGVNGHHAQNHVVLVNRNVLVNLEHQKMKTVRTQIYVKRDHATHNAAASMVNLQNGQLGRHARNHVIAEYNIEIDRALIQHLHAMAKHVREIHTKHKCAIPIHVVSLTTRKSKVVK